MKGGTDIFISAQNGLRASEEKPRLASLRRRMLKQKVLNEQESYIHKHLLEGKSVH